ncbi:protein SHI RELATED SEQUENCE 6-like [Vicia villosa]|uniref:protein SHI RELATED SEQUENCE 6-like n=1 Tax=Vicia villosa TaxID=3911 RepID=UPI00273C01BB|nr:protein SHI RELATED SEQUENCE 6-like [Vicia villosa]
MFGLRDLVFIAQTPSSLHHHHQQQNQPISSDHPPHPPNLPLPSSSALSVGLGIFPLLTTTHIDNNNNNNNNNQDSNFWNLKMCQPQQVMMMNSIPKRVEEDDQKIQNLMMGCDENGEFRVCQDCGNRAKKDCSFKRCRTCCKSRGFDCSTHVKSTWTPASMRRDRNGAVVVEGGGDSDGSSGSKRQRILMASSSHDNVAAATSHSSSSNAASRRSLSLDITSSCHQDVGFKQSLPRYVTAPAVFKCHRVSGIGSDEDEIAYLATVSINGHVFKGFVYDQGVVVDGKDETMGCVSELQLGSNGSGKSRECSSAIHVPATSAYPASAC